MSEEDPLTARLNALVKFEEPILEVKEELELSLEDNLLKTGQFPSEDKLLTSIRYPLSISVDDQEVRSDLSLAIANVILRWDEEHTQRLKELTDSQELVRFMLHLGTRFQHIVNRIILVDNQGKKFWNNVETELVIRQSGMPGLNHELELGIDREEVEVTTGPDSNVKLANYFLQQQIRLLQQYEEAVTHMDQQTLDVLEHRVGNLYEVIENVNDSESGE